MVRYALGASLLMLSSSCSTPAAANDAGSDASDTLDAPTADMPLADVIDAGPVDGNLVMTSTGPLVLPYPCPVPIDCSQNTSTCSGNTGSPYIDAVASPSSLVLPPGFHIAQYASGFVGVPRWLALAPNGDVFVTEYVDATGRYTQAQGSPPVVSSPSSRDRIEVLRDMNGDGVAETRLTFDDGATHTALLQPFGMAFHPSGALYVGGTGALLRYNYASGQTMADAAGPSIVTDLPAGGYNHHWTRNLLLAPDNNTLYVTVGSATNDDLLCESMDRNDPRRAAINAFDLGTSMRTTVASGLRNPNGLAFYPGSTRLFAVVNERDELGDDLVPDYLTEIHPGDFYGWPYWYFGAIVDPRHVTDHPALTSTPNIPDLPLGSHVAPLGLVFYTGSMFPADYSGDAFVTMHGSWNRHARVGYKVVRVHFVDGHPTSTVEDFVSGFIAADGSVLGRPVGLLQLPDGSLLIVDDGPPGGVIWRVTYG